CQGVPVGGECLSTSLVRYCSVPTGTGSPTVQVYAGPGGSTCTANGAGASCIQTGACRQGDKRCSGPTTAQTCNSSGNWGSNQTCANGCLSTAVGAECMAAGTTVTLNGSLRYETKNPNSTTFPTNWSAATPVPARNVMVLSMRGTSSIFDATVTDGNGGYSIKVPQSPQAGDIVVFLALGGDGFGARYEVANPGFSQAGEYSPGQTGTERTWNWSKAVSSLSNGGVTTITAAEGSGALNMYDLLQSIWSTSVANNQGRQGYTIRMWLQLGIEWSCGACYSEVGGEYDSEIWMPGAATDEGYWSDYTIAHELGHWQQASYGEAPNEGGTHILGCPTFPGQAWSEGYATWHSAAVRNRSFLEDKQQGTFFWFDISSRTYFPNSTSSETITGPGGTNLLAQIDENAVASMLWYLSNSRQTGSREIFNAVAGRHMTTTPWPRQYTRHTWQVGNNCTKTSVQNTGQSSPHVADLFDALSCGGSPAQSNRMPQATISQTCSSPTNSGNGAYYPFPAASPICRSGYCYGCTTGSTCNAGNTTAACGTNGVRCVACGSGQSCVNGVCL
ncbi:MAG: hypothetical protein ACO1OB_29765, partial [Archangium sp.]